MASILSVYTVLSTLSCNCRSFEKSSPVSFVWLEEPESPGMWRRQAVRILLCGIFGAARAVSAAAADGESAFRLSMSLRGQAHTPCVSLTNSFVARDAPFRNLRSCFSARMIKNGTLALLVGSGVPNHEVSWRRAGREVRLCEQDWKMKLPAVPVWSKKVTRLVEGVPLGVALNGVPIYPPLHSGRNRVDPSTPAANSIQCDGAIDGKSGRWGYR